MSKKSEKSKHHMGKLVYAMIQHDRECNFGNIGLNNERVYSIVYKNISIVVSDYPQVSSIKLLRKNLNPYHLVVRQCSKKFTTIPARFGQIACDEGEIGIAIRRNYNLLCQQLARLDGRVEMGLKVWWEVNDPITFFLEQEPELKMRRDQLFTKNKKISRNAQIEFGGLFHDKMNQARAMITKRILAELPSGEAKIGDIRETKMIGSLVMLVEKSMVAQLSETVELISQSMGEAYAFKLDGPWAPFSFVDRVDLHL